MVVCSSYPKEEKEIKDSNQNGSRSTISASYGWFLRIKQTELKQSDNYLLIVNFISLSST